MNREIKFRGMDANGIMRYGRLSQDKPDTTAYYSEYSQRICWDNSNIPVSNKTLSQYTGLKDKNGKEIYEGDVLEFWTFSATGNAVKNVSYVKEDGGIYVVPMLYHTNSYYLCDAIWISNKLEKGVFVIGNIYENPELITNL